MAAITPQQLRAGARVADGLVYAVGLAGVVAGGLLLRDQQAAWAVVAWALTFVAGAALRLAASGVRALAQLFEQNEAIQEAVQRLYEAGGPAPTSQEGGQGGERRPDPYRRWGGSWH